MSTVASRELRTDTAGVLRRVQAGEEVTVTVNGRAVAVIAAVRPRRRRWVPKAELIKRLDQGPGEGASIVDLLRMRSPVAVMIGLPRSRLIRV